MSATPGCTKTKQAGSLTGTILQCFPLPAGSGPLRLKFGLAKNRGRYDAFATFLDLTLQAVIVTVIACLDFPGAGTLRAFLRSYLLRFGRLLSWVFGGGGVG